MRAKKGLVLKGKKVAVVGLGVSGLSALKLLVQEEALSYAVNQGPVDAWAQASAVQELIPRERCLTQDLKDTEQALGSMDLIILSPGIPREHPCLSKAHLYNVPIWGEIELGWHFVHYPVLAVTGSNGKTTTTTLLAEMLRRAGMDVFVGGNIGVPLCEYARAQKAYDLILLELSSFQLESCFEFRADVAVILNLIPTHGERYKGLEDYGRAKWRLAERVHREGHLLYDKQNPLLDAWAQSTPCSSTAVDTARIRDMRSILRGSFSLDAFKLPGDHNLINLFFAVKALEIFNKRFNLMRPQDLRRGIQGGIDHFGGVPHRVQKVGEHAAVRLLQRLQEHQLGGHADGPQGHAPRPRSAGVACGGGKLRGQGESLRPHLEAIKKTAQKILAFGESANLIEEEIFDQLPLRKFRTLDDVISHVDESGHRGILLFSPAFPSFDLYKNYEQRGAHFCKLVGAKIPASVEGH